MLTHHCHTHASRVFGTASNALSLRVSLLVVLLAGTACLVADPVARFPPDESSETDDGGTTLPDGGVDQPPTLAFISPEENAVIVTNWVDIEVAANDDVGVAKVQFFVGDKLLGDVTYPPFSKSWSTQSLPGGTYVLKAVAIDSAGQSTTKTRQVTLGKSRKVEVMMDNCDDSCSVSINGSAVRTISLGQTTSWIDVSAYASPAANSNVLHFEVSNSLQGWAYGFHARVDGVTVVDDSCGVLYQYGCQNNDYTLGLRYSTNYQF